MSSLQRRYTDYFYRIEVKKNKEHLIKVPYMKQNDFLLMYPMAQLSGPQGEFPYSGHEERDFLPKKGKRGNHTHTRMKRKRKARIKARRAE